MKNFKNVLFVIGFITKFFYVYTLLNFTSIFGDACHEGKSSVLNFYFEQMR